MPDLSDGTRTGIQPLDSALLLYRQSAICPPRMHQEVASFQNWFRYIGTSEAFTSTTSHKEVNDVFLRLSHFFPTGTNLEAITTCELCKEKLRLNIDNFDIQELYRTHVQVSLFTVFGKEAELKISSSH